MKGTDYRSPLARARGLGSAKEGVRHWWAQRLTAAALVPLGLWFVASLVGLSGASYAEVRAWIAEPGPALMLVLLLIASLHHAQLGLQVVIEDYVHHEGARIAAVAVVKGTAVLLGALGVFAVLKIAFSG